MVAAELEYLLEGTDIKDQSSRGLTALIFAACNGHIETVEYLLNKGANLNNYNVLELVISKLDGDGKIDKLVKSISILSSDKRLLDLNKGVISTALENYMDNIIEYSLSNVLCHSSVLGLKNILSAFSNAGKEEFCQKFVTKVRKNIVNIDGILKVEFHSLNKANIHELTSALSKLKNLKESLYPINATQNIQYLIEFNKAVGQIYTQVEEYNNWVNKLVTDLTNVVVQSSDTLLGTVVNMPLKRGYSKTKTQTNILEPPAKNPKIITGIIENASANFILSSAKDIHSALYDAMDVDLVVRSSLGHGGVEETKGQS